jgi:NADPH:quinone reductase-like Zn-dependent oxidoreductase
VRAVVATGINESDPMSMLQICDDWPDPIAPEGHTLVRVAASSVNMHDLWTIRGIGARADQFPAVLGCDVAGWDADGNEVIVFETEQLLRFMEANGVRPLIDSVFPIEKVHDAFGRLQEPELYGKVVVRVGEP